MTDDDKIDVTILKLNPFTEEELKFYSKGLWPHKTLSIKELQEMFPCTEKQ